MTTATETEILDRAEINGNTVIVQYSRTEAALAILVNRYQGVVFDMTTTKGDKEARAARLELTTLRTSLEKKRKEFKAPALEFGKRIDSEAARVTAEIEALEKPIDAQIKADEGRRAAEKAERDRLAAERAAMFQAKISAIRACVGRCQGITSERIANGIAQVELIDVSPEAMEEFSGEATLAKTETLEAMRTMHDTAKLREDEAARVEAQRIENERVAAEQRRQAEALAAQQAALEQAAAELRAQQEAQKAEAERLEAAKAQAAAPAIAAPAPEPISAPELERPLAQPEIQQAGQEVQLQDQAPAANAETVQPAAAELPRADCLNLGEINAALGKCDVTAAQLKALGFESVGTERRSTLFRQSDFEAICDALAQHLSTIRGLYRRAA
ncbi:DUF1351 domain-containing protein [Curvibacter lanceolatus]|uniref:DUF1351 domain-containing protein n=1 Tax=Curvibacter lanceolatus TaxID=86182 RepID=UPI00037F424C|nr:DUF1351 domain-containing protein [Curvibacter lanceolatus]